MAFIIRTNVVDIEFNLRAQKLVPLVNGMDQVTTTIKGASAAERVRKGSIWSEVCIDSFCLFSGRSLAQLMHDTSDFFGRIIHDRRE